MSEELKNKIISAIKKGEVTMRPRWHFVLRSTLCILGIVICALLLLFLSSLVLFLLRANGVFFAPLFGFHGLRSFFFALPWLLLLSSLLFIIILEILARFYGIGRKTPLLYSAVGIILFVFVASFIVVKTTFHERMSARAMDGHLPFVGGMYKGFPEPPDIHRGRITELVEGGFIITSRRGGTTSVMILPDTRLPYGVNFSDEDVVVVFGEAGTSGIMAEGILQVGEEGFDPRAMRGHGGKKFFQMHPIEIFEAGVATSSVK